MKHLFSKPTTLLKKIKQTRELIGADCYLTLYINKKKQRYGYKVVGVNLFTETDIEDDDDEEEELEGRAKKMFKHSEPRLRYVS